jgi:hypothetical protein
MVVSQSKDSLQNGLVSSHFFFLFRQVVQPVFDRAFVAFDEVVGERGGYNLGRPRPRLTRAGSVGDMEGSDPTDSALTSASCSSCSSILGTISSEPRRESFRDSAYMSGRPSALESTVGVSIGDSLLEDMEDCGEELRLKRARAPGGRCPNERVEIIRPGVEGDCDGYRCSKRCIGR